MRAQTKTRTHVFSEPDGAPEGRANRLITWIAGEEFWNGKEKAKYGI